MSRHSAKLVADAPGWIPALNRALETLLTDYPHRTDELLEAALYSVGSPGHRWRPILLLTIYERLAGRKFPPDALPLACAVEFLHTASIILDDLPAMDDATLRRGAPPCHAKFGQSRAILTAHWLCDVAQHWVGGVRRTHPGCAVDLEDAFRAVKNEMMRGQTMDLEWGDLSEEETIEKYRLKSGALYGFTASAPAHLLGSTVEAECLKKFGNYLGIAYQLSDDLHDMTDTVEGLGKDVRKDEQKKTIPYIYGVERTLELKELYIQKCLRELKTVDNLTFDLAPLVEKICL